MATTEKKEGLTFNPTAAKKPIEDWVTSMGVPELKWAWEVVRDCMDVVAHHSTPWGETRASQKSILWLEFFGSFLFDANANYVVHGFVKELKAACPDDIAHGLHRVVREGYEAGDARTPAQKAASLVAHQKARQGMATTPVEPPPLDRVSTSPTPKPSPFTVILGGRED
jgi:hypothetical protein